MDRYLSFYSPEFRPESGLTRGEWAAQRHERVPRPEWIRLTLGPFESAPEGPERVSVAFDQTYETPNYGDAVRKMLTLVREDGAWKIAVEHGEPI